jgi:hypothetical protein
VRAAPRSVRSGYACDAAHCAFCSLSFSLSVRPRRTSPPVEAFNFRATRGPALTGLTARPPLPGRTPCPSACCGSVTADRSEKGPDGQPGVCAHP